MMKLSAGRKSQLVTLFMVGVSLVMVFPIYVIFTNSFKSLREFYESPIQLPSALYLNNYDFVFGNVSYFRLLGNNMIVLTCSLALLIFTGAMAGYVIARRPTRLKKLIYLFFVFGITLPTFTMLVPQIKLIGQLGLKNNFLGLILLYGAMGLPMSLFLYNGFFSTVPKELEESAKIDGCSFGKMFFKIFFPLSIPTTSTLILLQTIAIWNDTVLPDLIMTYDSMKTLMPGLQTFYGRMLGQGTRWDYIYAFIVLCIIPIIVLFFIVNRYLVRGVIEGALKG